MARAARRVLICALAISALAGVAGVGLLSGVFAPGVPSRVARQPEAPRPAVGVDPGAPIETAATPPDVEARGTVRATLRTRERHRVDLQVVPESRGALAACAEAARSASLASAQAQDGAPVTLDVPALRDLRLVATVEGETIARWSAVVQPLAPDASIEILVPLPEEAGRLHGVVLDAATSRPIAGASIEPDAAAEALHCLRATTAADGSFSLPDPAGVRQGVVVRVSAAGYASRRLSIDRDLHGYGENLLRLDRAAKLAVTVRRSEGAPVSGIEVEVSPASTPASRMPRELALTDASGSVVADVPSGRSLQLNLYRDGRLLREEPDVAALSPGERREIAIELDGVRVRGRIVDQNGSPVGPGRIGIRNASSRRVGFTPGTAFVAEVPADRDGRFAFADVPSGRWYVEPAAGEAEHPNVASIPVEIVVLPGAGAVDVTVVVYRDLSIAGEVVDFAGRPVSGVTISGWASTAGSQHQVRTRSDAAGRFVLGPLGPLEYSVSSFSPATAVKARAGARDVVVRLRPAAAVRGVVLDARTGLPTRASVHARHVADDVARSYTTQTGTDGTFSFDELGAGRWRIDAETALQRGHLPELSLRAGEVIENLELRVEDAATLEIVSTVPNARLTVAVEGRAVCAILAVEEVSRCVVEPGALIVREYAPAAGVTRELQIHVREGERRRVEFGTEP